MPVFLAKSPAPHHLLPTLPAPTRTPQTMAHMDTLLGMAGTKLTARRMQLTMLLSLLRQQQHSLNQLLQLQPWKRTRPSAHCYAAEMSQRGREVAGLPGTAAWMMTCWCALLPPEHHSPAAAVQAEASLLLLLLLDVQRSLPRGLLAAVCKLLQQCGAEALKPAPAQLL